MDLVQSKTSCKDSPSLSVKFQLPKELSRANSFGEADSMMAKTGDQIYKNFEYSGGHLMWVKQYFKFSRNSNKKYMERGPNQASKEFDTSTQSTPDITNKFLKESE